MIFDPEAAHYLVPAEHAKLDPNERAKEEAAGEVAGVQEQAAFTSFLFTHNISVAFLAFGLGITVGVGTAVLLFSNGLMLGALAYTYAAKGLAGWFWAWILPHGIPEITAICLAGGAGFQLARGLALPRGLSRSTSLRREALFVLAGFIEGTISQIHPPKLSVELKIGFALVVGAGVYAYLLSGWLRGRAQSAPRALMSR
jgi:uncharacterized membrane protein SpoIIM required for sporulation